MIVAGTNNADGVFMVGVRYYFEGGSKTRIAEGGWCRMVVEAGGDCGWETE